MGELIVLTSMAKSASESRIHYAGQCECQAIYLVSATFFSVLRPILALWFKWYIQNKKCLELATILACKVVLVIVYNKI